MRRRRFSLLVGVLMTLLRPEQIGHGATDGDVVTFDSGTGRCEFRTPTFALNGYVLKSFQTFTADGTWTAPAGVTAILIELVGGGGGGGGVAGGAGQAAAASGGGGGGYARKWVTNADSESPAAVTIGPGGAGGSAGANDGSDGGFSSFALMFGTPFAYGGLHGLGASAGSAISALEGGDAGFGVDAQILGAGGAGGPGIRLSGTVAIAGAGGSSYFGGMPRAGITSGAGIQATGYGGGGGGAVDTSNTNRAGGNGLGGICIVWEFGQGQ